eukprot:TRINITY_DN67797_c0_g1_i1.p1 TRINITY_DN67797_c0_g1~~TRINITY_DN67797_c0_g1_i1.p1  ORF type:complete len:241 (+),score=38.36 TRINITY_DN67797_c0_g1_i1:20-742(+)
MQSHVLLVVLVVVITGQQVGDQELAEILNDVYGTEDYETPPVITTDNVWKQAQNFIKNLEEQTKQLEYNLNMRELDISEREKAMALLDAKVATAGNTRIKLNVGGKIFETTKKVLTKHKDTFFFNLFRSDDLQTDDADGIFIDRSPHFFDVILDWFRTDKLFLDVLTLKPAELERFKDDLEYYRLVHLQQNVDAQLEQKTMKEEQQRNIVSSHKHGSKSTHYYGGRTQFQQQVPQQQQQR